MFRCQSVFSVLSSEVQDLDDHERKNFERWASETSGRDLAPDTRLRGRSRFGAAKARNLIFPPSKIERINLVKNNPCFVKYL